MARDGMHKTVILISALAITLTMGFVGGGLASAEIVPLGYILLGVGLGGFALIIVGSIIIVSLMSRHAEKKAARPRLTPTGGIGKVVDVRVDTDSDSDELGYVIKLFVDDSVPELTFKCKKRHRLGDPVEFYGDPRLPDTLKLPSYSYDE